jgi:hypothetical protein
MTRQSFGVPGRIGPKLTEIGPVFDSQGLTMQVVVKKSQKVYQNFTGFYRILIF